MEALNEMSSINRVLRHMNEFDTACLTANRNTFCNETPDTLDDRPENARKDNIPYKYTEDDNKVRNRDLAAALLKLGYGVTRINGNYVENFGEDNAVEVRESSFFVVNLNDDPDFFGNIFKLSERYNQDSFLYKQKGSQEAYLVGTNKAEFPGYGKRYSVGSLHVNIRNEFISRIKKNSFAFTDNQVPENDVEHPASFAERKKRRKELINCLNLKTYESYERPAKMCIASIFENLVNAGFNKIQNKTIDDTYLIEDFTFYSKEKSLDTSLV